MGRRRYHRTGTHVTHWRRYRHVPAGICRGLTCFQKCPVPKTHPKLSTNQDSPSLDDRAKNVTVMVMQGIAVGTFLYVTFFEVSSTQFVGQLNAHAQVLIHERDNEHPNMLKLAFIVLGFATIGLLRLFDEHSHGTDLTALLCDHLYVLLQIK